MAFLRKALISLLLLTNYSALSQSTRIAVKIFKEHNELVSRRPLKIELICDDDTTTLESNNDSFLIADILQSNQYTVVLTKGKLKLVFPNLYISWNELLPLWIVKIDYSPINENNDYWFIPKDDFKKVRWVYTLEREGRTRLSFYGFNKPFNY